MVPRFDRPGAPALRSTRAVWREVAPLVVLNRVAVFVVMWLTMVYWPPAPPPPGVMLGTRPNAANILLDGWMRWDVHWYWSIARDGYTNLPRLGDQRDTAFFPAYPLLVRGFNLVVPDTYVAGLVASNACLGLSAFFLFRLAERFYGVQAARRAVLLLLVYPWSFILSAMYTESLFLASLLAAFYFAERERWSLAGLAAGVTAATRVLGFSVLPALLLLYLEKKRWRVRATRWDVLGIGLALLPPGAHILYLQQRFKDPLAFLKAQDVAGWSSASSLERILPEVKECFRLAPLMSGTAHVQTTIQMVVLALGVAACVACLRRGRIAYGVWGLVYLVLSFHKWDGYGRYLVVVFPVYLAGALWLRRPTRLATVAAFGCMLMGILMLLFSHWKIVT
jgi:hypothetical protein